MRNGPDFTQVYEEHVWDVYGFIAYRVHTREDAEDLSRQTFERGARSWSRYDEKKGSPRTWLLAIARNLVVDHFRAVRPTPSLEGAGDDSLPSGPPEVEANLGLSQDLSTALDRLSDRDREVIALRFGGAMKGAEIAAALGLPLPNVQQILERSLRRLREEMMQAPDGSAYPPTGGRPGGSARSQRPYASDAGRGE